MTFVREIVEDAAIGVGIGETAEGLSAILRSGCGAAICESSGTPPCAERDRLVDDIAALSDVLAGLMRVRWLRLRLYVVTTNVCLRFHIDAVAARLVGTYRDAGTQYGTSTDGAEPWSPASCRRIRRRVRKAEPAPVHGRTAPGRGRIRPIERGKRSAGVARPSVRHGQSPMDVSWAA